MKAVSFFILLVLSLPMLSPLAVGTYAVFDNSAQVKPRGSPCGGFMNVAGDCEPGMQCVYRLGSTYGEYRTGLCETEGCAKHGCGYRQRCVRGKGCVCPAYNCIGKRNYVCAYDGKTYRSVCHLQEKECTGSYYIGIKSMGRCPDVNSTDSNSFSGFELDENTTTIKARVKKQSCWFYGRVYKVGEKVDLDDPCLNGTCTDSGLVLIMNIPGCGAGLDEPYVPVDEPAVAGVWGDWSSWGPCLGDCCNTTQSRTRFCNPPQNEGENCIGHALEQRHCYPSRCCKYSAWSAWSACSVTCNRGKKTRTRTVSSKQDPSCCILEESHECANYKDIYEPNFDMRWNAAHARTPGPEITCYDGPCQLHHVNDKHVFEDSDCHSYCKFNVAECGGTCNSTGNCLCLPTKVKELKTFAFCPWSKGRDPSEPSHRLMPFLLPLECGCVACTGDEELGGNDTWKGPVITEKEINMKHPC